MYNIFKIFNIHKCCGNLTNVDKNLSKSKIDFKSYPNQFHY